ncbi:MAG TPA: TolC family protein [Candidatus Sulfotelmatobacter sp.]|jgi:outer membrane protein|nr:TolC family protein [Candidatus Sulfotelmatobacter sp.]
MMGRAWRLGAAILLCSAAACAQEKTDRAAPKQITLTLAQAEAIALKNNPTISEGRLRTLVAQEFVREQRSALLPNASVNLTGVGSNPGSRVAAGGLNNPVIYPRAAEGAVLSQLITDFGRTTNLVSSARYQAEAEAQNEAATRAQILLAVDHAFYGALETQALVQVAEQTVEARQALADKVSALTKAKLKSELDLSFANVDLSRAKLLLLEAKNNSETSLAELSAILGYPDLQDFKLVEEPEEAQSPEPDPSPLIQEALRQRPEANAVRLEEQAAEKFSRAEHDLWRPTITGLGVVGEAPVRDDHIPNWYGAAGVNIQIPVFNGLLNKARAKTADLQTEASHQRLVNLQNNIARDVRIAWQDSNRVYQRLSLTQELRQQSDLALELAQSRYNLGLSSIVEFSQAELQKTEADISDTAAQYEFQLSRRMLRYVTGDLK